MIRKLLAVFCLSILFTPSFSHADEIVTPTANLTIVVNTQGQEEGFHFDLKILATPFWEDWAAYDLQTVNFTAQQTNIVDFFWGGNYFWLNQSVGTPDINCLSDDPANTFDYERTDSGVVMFVEADASSIICTFDNAAGDQRSPVLIVPGILGTEMFKDEARLWASILRMVNPLNSDDFMDPLAFNSDLSASDMDVFFGSVISNPDNLFDYTEGLITEFTSQGYVENQDLFTFPYDWRYGVAVPNNQSLTNVDLLKLKIDEILTQTGASKVDVIAHSTGGLIVKKHVMDNPADHQIDKAVFVGVPNLGAPKAVKVLVQGDNFGVLGLSDAEMKKIAQNMPVAYDLAPSPTFFNLKGSFLRTIDDYFLAPDVITDLDYQDAWDLLIQRGANETAFTNAENIHSLDFENFDLRTAGIDAYNIVGCKSGTIGGVVERRVYRAGNTTILYDDPEFIMGDSTVPYESANSNSADDDQKYYVPKSDHAKLLSANGSRQLIVNLIAGTNLDTDNRILTRDELLATPNKCQLKGKKIEVLSPLDVEGLDQSGNRSGIAEDGSIQNDIPGADFEVYGEHKFVYLPDGDGETYEINLQGTGTGTFTLKNETIEDDETTGSENFINIPVTPDLQGNVELTLSGTVLNLDIDGNGTIDEILSPNSILNPEESQDLLAPSTTASFIGTAGQPGFFRSDVEIALNAMDPVIPGEEDQTSGILETLYQLDTGEWESFSPPPGLPSQGGGMGALTVSAEGVHTLNFYSVDRAGNTEPIQTREFTIDRTPPEAVLQFSLTDKDLQFSGRDNISPPDKLQILDLDDTLTITDEAGNQTILKLKEKERRKRHRVEINELIYNGTPADISRTVFRVRWELDKQQNLKSLEQYARSRRDFYLEALSKNNRTKITGRDKNGKISLDLPGFVSLQIRTNAGDIEWGY